MSSQKDSPKDQQGNHRPHVPKKAYTKELAHLQVQLVEMQRWVIASGARVVVVFEGRDAAGKGGVIKRVMQYLNPRSAKVVALPQPTDREKGQWYFQRYITHLPSAGEIVLFDRSWYNRGGVERVMGYATPEQHALFLEQTPLFEKMLTDDGIILIKYWFSVSDTEQVKRFKSRRKDPTRRWKLSPTDLMSITRWEDYSRAKDEMFDATDSHHAPWWTIESDDKKAARLNTIAHLLSRVPWTPEDPEKIKFPKRPAAHDYERPPRELHRYVPDLAAELTPPPDATAAQTGTTADPEAAEDKTVS